MAEAGWVRAVEVGETPFRPDQVHTPSAPAKAGRLGAEPKPQQSSGRSASSTSLPGPPGALESMERSAPNAQSQAIATAASLFADEIVFRVFRSLA